MKPTRLCLLLILLLLAIAPHYASANDQITYLSQPEAVAIFLNDVALARDSITLGGGAAVSIVLPNQVFPDTLILRENGERITRYTINRSSGQTILRLQTSAPRSEITLEYLLAGISWKPTYDMWIVGGVDDDAVQMDFLVEIQNNALHLQDVAVRLVAGRVDTSQQLSTISTVTANQVFAGYEQTDVQPVEIVGAVTIQHVYDAGTLSADMGDALYVMLLGADFPARRVILWNAQADRQAQVIYKVTNDSTLPLPEGTVRTYQDDLFIGSDFIEVTPVGGEGSVTVGGVQDVRVSRSESETYLDGALNYEYLHEVTLSLSSFSSEAVTVEVIDLWNPRAKDFVFSQEPNRESGNILRWVVVLPPGESLTLTYEFKTD